MKRFALILLAIMVMVASSLGAAATTYAASIYDNFYRTTDELIIQGGGSGGCSPTDITDWSSYITDEDKWWIPNQGYNDMLDDMLVSWNNKERWGVSVNTSYSDTSSSTIHVYWTEDNSLYMNWESTFSRITTAGNNVKLVEIKCGKATYLGAPAEPIVTSFAQDSSIVSTDDTGNVKNLFFYGNPNYPQDYEGIPIREEIAMPSQYKPEILWTVGTDGRFTAVPIITDLEIPTVGGGSMSPQILHKLFAVSGNEEIFSSADIISAPVGFNLPSYGAYRYEVTYIHPGPP